MSADHTRAPGDGARAPIAWVHGYTMSSAIWPRLWSLLPGEDHLGLDMPGHGTRASEPIPGGLRPLGDDVAARMTDSGARILAGLSFGSAVALQAALDHPETVGALVMAAPTLAGMPEDPAGAAKYFLLVRHLLSDGPGPDLARIWMADPPRIFTGLRAHPAAYDELAAIIAEHPFAELRTAAMAGVSRERHTPEMLASLTIPVLVVVGDDDMPVFVDAARTLQEHVADCTVVTVAGAGHLPLLERPRECAAAIGAWLAELPPAVRRESAPVAPVAGLG